MTRPPSNVGHLGSLDVARGLAALAVAIFHFTHNGQWLPTEHWFARGGWYGHLGVRTFFVISGIVVPLAMARGGYTLAAIHSFLTRRMVRLYPPYVVSVVVMAVMAWWGGKPPTVTALAAHFAYLNDALGLPWLIDVYWTLAIEVQFYVALALLWPLAASRRTWPFFALAVATIAGACLSCSDRGLPRYGLYFLLGVAAFRWHEALGSRGVNLLAALAATLLTWRDDGVAAAIAAATPLVFLFCAPHVATLTPSHRALQLVARSGRFLGDVSYSLYLFHLAAGATFLAALRSYVTATSARSLLVLAAIALSMAAAWLAYLTVEVPAIGWAKRFKYRPRA